MLKRRVNETDQQPGDLNPKSSNLTNVNEA